MDEQHNHPEGVDPQGYEPAPEQHEPSPFEQYVPEPPAPPVMEEVAASQAAPAIEAEIPAVGAASKRAFLSRPWKGEEKLWKVFWLYGVVGGAILQTVVAALAGVGGMALLIPGLLVMLVFAVWNIVSLWRCAWNAQAKFWGYIVRVLCALSALSYASTVIGLIASPADGPVKQPVTHGVVAPAVPSPTPSPVAPVAPIAAAPVAPAAVPHYSPCEQKMADFATANGADPKAYIAQNQAWLAQCNQIGGVH